MASSDLASYQLQLQQVSIFFLKYQIKVNSYLNQRRHQLLVIFKFELQVEAALTADPENTELLTLKGDLQQVIDLTKELVSTEAGETTQESDKDYDESSRLSSSDPQNFDQQTNSEENIVAKGHKRKYEYEHVEDIRQPIKHWQVGEECQALSHKDGQ